MWSNPAGAAGYRDPTSLFQESDSSSSSSSASSNDEDYETLQELFSAAPGLLSTSPSASKWRKLLFHRGHSKDECERTQGEREAEEERRRQQRERQERRFFKKRGALDFQNSVVFEAVEQNAKKMRSEDQIPITKTTSRAAAAAEAEVFQGSPLLFPFSPQQTDTFDQQNGDCVPVELQAWYMATNANPAAVPRPNQNIEEQQRQQRANSATKTNSREKKTGPRSNTKEQGEEEMALGLGSDNAVLCQTSPFKLAAVEPAVRSSGAGTTSVNILRSRAAPDSEARQALRAAAVTTVTSTALPSVPSRQKRRAAPDSEKTAAAAEGQPQERKKDKKDGKGGSADPTTLSPLQNPFTTASANEALPAALSSSPFSSIGHSNSKASSSGGSEDDLKQRFGLSPKQQHGDDEVVDTQAKSDSVRCVDSGFSAGQPIVTTNYADGGRPSLRAHRYVEQPNGLFIDHAEHANLMAQYALEEQLRYAQAREDARRARRWNRLLHGGSSKHAEGDDIILSKNGTGGSQQEGGGRNSSATTEAVRARYHFVYEAATYRRKYVSVLRYLQRVHVFMVGVAAGVSLLTLIAITVPFPELKANEVEDGLPSGMSAVVLLAILNTTATDTQASSSLPTAQVLPILQQGHTALALFLSLLQPYHASLFLFLCMLLVITGFSPIPWGVAERYWTTQRRRWLTYDEAERKGTVAAESGTRSNCSNNNSNYFCYYSDDDRGGLSGSPTMHYTAQQSQQLQSPFIRTWSSAPLSPHRKSVTHTNDSGGGRQHRSRRRLSTLPFFQNQNNVGGSGPLAAQFLYPSMQRIDPRFGTPIGGGTLPSPLRGAYDRRASTRLSMDPLRNSVSFGYARGGVGGYSDDANNFYGTYGGLGASFSGTTSQRRAGRSVYMVDPGIRHHDGAGNHHHNHNYFGENNNNYNYNCSSGCTASVKELPSSFLSFTRNGYGAGGGKSNGGLLSDTATMTGLGCSPPPSVTDVSLLQSQYRNYAASRSGIRGGGRGFHNCKYNFPGGGGRTASSVSSQFDDGGRSPRGTRSLQNFPYPSPFPAPILLFPVAMLEGHLSASNAFTRTFDYVERRTMQWICNTIKCIFRSCRRGADDTGNSNSRRGEERTRGEKTADSRCDSPATAAIALFSQTPLRDPAVPISLYLHVLLQPRLWCVVVALALTLVEIAFVDERSVELMWLAQPSSWWSPTPFAQHQPVNNKKVVLPHAWMTAVFTYPSIGFDGTAVNATDATVYGNTGKNRFDDGGRVGRVMLAVYATRTAMIWVAFFLNLFF